MKRKAEKKGADLGPLKISMHSQGELGRIVTSQKNYSCTERERAWEDLKSLGEGLSTYIIEWVAGAAPCRQMRQEAQALLTERRARAVA